MYDKNYKHAIKVDTNICIGCSHCMRVCPTHAIRIADGQAQIKPEFCVDCGECYRVCPVSAIGVEDDGLNFIKKYKYRIAIVPSVFIGQFSSKYNASQVIDAVRQVGFDEVMEVEQAVDFVKSEYALKSRENIPHPVISSFCPAVVRLIQVIFPYWTENILLLKPPHDIAALYLRKTKEDTNINPEEVGIFYITPCASKIVAAKAPEGELKSPIDGAINMKELYNKVYKILLEENNKGLYKKQPNLTPDSVNWSLSGTEKQYFEGRSLAIDGMDKVIEFMEKLDNGQISNVDFLEFRACDQGCAGGILCPANRFLTVERLEQRRKKLEKLSEITPINNPLIKYQEFLHKNAPVNSIFPREGILLDADREKALKKIDQIKALQFILPGLDCGACGAPSCRKLAEDIVQKKAEMSHCVFVLQEMVKLNKVTPDEAMNVIEQIWGKDRMNKYNYNENENHA
ncbi:4Fe-4S binding domain protein [uncultured Paludibacter sp.]|uniref:4Fe-4S binding domain protein n=1 Tax=uncultured Paludibacter sp. TaxID=497635 RepID=A0A653ACL6_9BACT|nr:4Fe-4S binding domain protein [uncultured Paludibacter sp.]